MEGRVQSGLPVVGILRRVALISIVVLLIAYLVLGWRIGLAVESISRAATNVHPGDRVEALIAYASCEAHSLRERNRAIWALGQLGDERALPFLDSLDGGVCDHDHRLCQREIRKAIKLCEGATNVAAVVWR
jgi:hypothetical protein